MACITSVWRVKTIRKAPLAEAQTTLDKQKYVLWNAGNCPITEFCEKLLPRVPPRKMSQSGNRLLSYRQKTTFKNERRPRPAILNFFKCSFIVISLSSSPKCVLCTKFHQNWMIQIWPFNDLQYSGYRPS